jgi:hypothetical protein
MSSSELERFLSAEGRSAVDRFMRQVAQEESDDFDVAEVLDRNLYDAVAGYDNRAGLSRWLSLRGLCGAPPGENCRYMTASGSHKNPATGKYEDNAIGQQMIRPHRGR